jgi:hypothetical protein
MVDKLPPPTDEQLRLAFRHVSRPGWPSTLEATLEHPLYRTCLIQMARNLNRRGIDRAPARTAPALPPLPLFDESPDAS